MEEIDKVLLILELAVRGKCTTSHETELLSLSNDLLDKTSKAELPPDMDDTAKTKMVNTAVLLHNKVRNLSTNGVHKRIKSLIRATSAWMLSTYGQKSQKVLCTCIKLHTRCAAELFSFASGTQEFAMRSIGEALSSWEAMNTSALEQTLALPELEELRLAVFDAYLARGKAMVATCEEGPVTATGDCNIDTTEAIIPVLNKATEILQSMLTTHVDAGQLRTRYLDAVTMLAARVAALPQSDKTTAVAMFVMALRIADITSSQLKPTDQTRRCKYRIYSALAYVHGQQHRFDQALHCISRAEELILQLRGSTAGADTHRCATEFSKLYFLCRSGDSSGAQHYLERVLQAPEAVDSGRLQETYAKMVIMLSEASITGQPSAVAHLQNIANFDALQHKYPDCPEFSAARLAKLTYLVASEQGSTNAAAEPGIAAPDTAMALLASIIADHASGAKPLTAEQAMDLLKVTRCTVTYFAAASNYDMVEHWSALGLQVAELVGATGGSRDLRAAEERAALLLLRSEALLYTGHFERALTAADLAWEMQPSADALQLAFFAAVYSSENAETALEKLSQRLHKRETADVSTSFDATTGVRCILQCYRALLETSARVRGCPAGLDLNAVQQGLLRFLLGEYEAHFEQNATFPLPAGDSGCSYLGALCSLLQGFLSQYSLPLSAEPAAEGSVPDSDLASEPTGHKRKLSGLSGAPTDLLQARREVYAPLSSLLHLLQKAPLGSSRAGVGAHADMDWLLRAAFHVSTRLLEELREPEEGDREACEQTELVAGMFELVQQLIAAVVTPAHASLDTAEAQSSDASLRVLQLRSLLFAGTLRLDLDAMAQTGAGPSRAHLELAHKDILVANSLLSTGTAAPSEDDQQVWRALQMNTLSLELLLHCRQAPAEATPGQQRTDALAGFVAAKREVFLQFAPGNLEALAAISQAERHCSLPAIRELLSIALEASLKLAPAAGACICTAVQREDACRLYSRVISLSATRQQALERVESFEQYCQAMRGDAHDAGADNSAIDEHIEAVAIRAYNNAVVLMELGQYDLAERFVTKVICLQKHLSNDKESTLAQWRSSIQDTYLALLKLKRDGATCAVMEPLHAESASIGGDSNPGSGTAQVQKDLSLSLSTLLS